MINQRGQAFSVFELMIAAIVAIAILAVLMSILGTGLFNPTTNPTDSIAKAISTAAPNGEANAQSFSVDSKSAIIVGKDIAEKADLDQRSVVLFAGELDDRFTCDTEESSSNDEPYSYCKYIRSTGSNATAKVYCSTTGDDLIDKLELALDSDIEWDSGVIKDVCEEDTYQPCCAAIMMR